MQPRFLYVLLAGIALHLAGCGGGSTSGSSFRLRDTAFAISPGGTVVVGESRILILADEMATGQGDLNGDGDTDDDVAVVVRMGRDPVVLGVAARYGAVLRGQVYLVVDEAEDGQDWNGVNGTGDRVLLNWSQDAGVVALVDTLHPETADDAVFTVGRRLYYASDATSAMGDETALRYVDRGDALLPVAVLNAPGEGFLRPLPLAEDDGLLFARVDENDQGDDLNGDGDATDTHVLCLLDVTDEDEALVVAGVAVADDDAPFDVRFDGDDWLVALLVDEMAQGGVSLNDAALFSEPILPAACAADTDADDQVLHYLRYADLRDGVEGAINAGIAGRDRVVVVEDAVATLAGEDASACDYNDDGDTNDAVVRWVVAELPVRPPNDPEQLHAVQTALPGGALGFTRLEDRLVCVVGEAEDGRDQDGKPDDNDLVAWVDPLEEGDLRWTFSHQSDREEHGTSIFASDGASEPFAGASWMAQEESGRVGIAFQESVPGTNPLVGSLNNNVLCDLVAKDTDVTDELPVWADFESGPTLDLDGTGFALEAGNAGIVVRFGFVFFRVDEAADGRDYNGDGDMGDAVLMRNPIFSCEPRYMAVVSRELGPVVVVDDFLEGGAFISSEADAGIDWTGDGDMDDLVVRYFEF